MASSHAIQSLQECPPPPPPTSSRPSSVSPSSSPFLTPLPVIYHLEPLAGMDFLWSHPPIRRPGAGGGKCHKSGLVLNRRRAGGRGSGGALHRGSPMSHVEFKKLSCFFCLNDRYAVCCIPLRNTLCHVVYNFPPVDRPHVACRFQEMPMSPCRL